MAWVLHGLISVIALVCFILVVVRMFQAGQTGLGIVTLVTILCFGIGFLIAFIYGWVKANEWKIQPVMLVWTVCVVIGIVLNFALPLPLPIGR